MIVYITKFFYMDIQNFRNPSTDFKTCLNPRSLGNFPPIYGPHLSWKPCGNIGHGISVKVKILGIGIGRN